MAVFVIGFLVFAEEQSPADDKLPKPLEVERHHFFRIGRCRGQPHRGFEVMVDDGRATRFVSPTYHSP
jgi:hypothetical protein